VSPANPRDAHVPLGKRDLREILCFEYRRSVSRDYAVSFECRLFQILKDSRPLPRPGDKVTSRARLGSSLDIYYRGKKRSVKEIKPREKRMLPDTALSFCRGHFYLALTIYPHSP
jgi:hypothetical protein